MKKVSIPFFIIGALLVIGGVVYDSVKNVVPMDKLMVFVVGIIVIFVVQIFVYSKHIAIGFRANDLPKECKYPCHVFATDENCCIREYHKHLLNNSHAKVIASSAFFDKYKLLSKEDMLEHEDLFGKGLKSSLDKREIWIFSYDLSTEVGNDSFQSVAAMNVNVGIKYVYFYINERRNVDIVERNKQHIRQLVVSNKRKTHILFVPIVNDQPDVERLNLLPIILGSIIFIKHINNTVSKESYFSIRKDLKDIDPIYFKMPTCMRDAFYDYFASLIPVINRKTTRHAKKTKGEMPL